MSRHRADVRRRGRWVPAVGAVLATGVAIVVGLGLIPPQATPDVSASVTTGAHQSRAADGVSRAVSGRATSPRRVAPPLVLTPKPSTAVPADSGSGRRVVFDQAAQRVWLIEDDARVARTYLVSGSVYDNLDPGSYSVFSRSEQAWGIDDSGTMRNFVRFARGENAAIGFHDIPVHNGVPLQTEAELGTPLSHGCIRQRRGDALALWDFAPIGTPVVVV